MRSQAAKARLAIVFGAYALGGAGCASHQSTHRVFEGHSVAGRYIEPQAYAAYAEGSYLEARGSWEEAEQAYRRALARDPSSPGIWTRLGVIACRGELKNALQHFQTDGVGRDYAPAWAGRAACLRAQGRHLEALESARRALELDPDNAQVNLLIADLYQQQSRPRSSRAWLFAWLLRDPNAASHWQAILERAELLGDTALQRLALAEATRTFQPTLEARSRPAAPQGAAFPEVELALEAGDLFRARIRANERGLAPLGLALLAIAKGRPDFGLAQAELILDADPKNSDALVAALYASAVLGESGKLDELLARAPESRLPNAESARQMAELLRWHVGDTAAEQWARAYSRVQAAAP